MLEIGLFWKYLFIIKFRSHIIHILNWVSTRNSYTIMISEITNLSDLTIGFLYLIVDTKVNSNLMLIVKLHLLVIASGMLILLLLTSVHLVACILKTLVEHCLNQCDMVHLRWWSFLATIFITTSGSYLWRFKRDIHDWRWNTEICLLTFPLIDDIALKSRTPITETLHLLL